MKTRKNSVKPSPKPPSPRAKVGRRSEATSNPNSLNNFRKRHNALAEKCREHILSNLALVNQIPAPTFRESNRAQYLLDHFATHENLESYIDEAGNVVASSVEKKGLKKVVLFAHMDTNFDERTDHDVTFTKRTVSGPGVCDNGLGLAFLISLPDILETLGEAFKLDLTFLATTQSQGKGDMKGIHSFIKSFKKNKESPETFINLMGVNIGRIDHFSLSRVRCDISCRLKAIDQGAYRMSKQTDAIRIMNDLINMVLKIPIPSKPQTSVNLGKISGGESYSKPSQHANLSLEIVSEEDAIVDNLVEQINDLCIYTSSKYGSKLRTHFFGQQHATELHFTHPLVKTTYGIINSLGYQPIITPSNTEISVPLSMGISAITIGLTTGSNIHMPDSAIDLHPIRDGLMQVLMLLHAISEGFCDEKD